MGNIPLLRLRRLSELPGCEILGKAEFMNCSFGALRTALNLASMRELGFKMKGKMTFW